MEIFLAIIGIIIVYLYILYAGMIRKKNKVKEALGGIDVQLKKRSNLIPNILTIAKKFMEHETKLLTEVTKLRSKTDNDYNGESKDEVKAHFQAAEALGANMGQLMIAVEAYPDLKSDRNMLEAQQTYREIEEQIAAARRFYNAAVGDLNNAVEIFPGNLVAGFARATEMPFYETDEASKAPIDASQFL